MATNEKKRTRRNRYIEAVEPFRKKYACSAAEVYSVIQGIERKNADLMSKNQGLEAEVSNLKASVTELEARAKTGDQLVEAAGEKIAALQFANDMRGDILLTREKELQVARDEISGLLDQLSAKDDHRDSQENLEARRLLAAFRQLV